MAPILIVATVVSAAVVLFAAAETSSARFLGRTDNQGNLWTSALIELDVTSEIENQAQLFLNGSNLYPGQPLENCLRIIDSSSLDEIDYRLFAPATEGELDRFLNITISTAQLADDQCIPDEAGEVLFQGTLRELATQHNSFSSGLRLDAALHQAEVALHVEGALVDVNEAQGLTVSYDVVLEARPA
ncbi:MAG: hypothetical protein ACRBK7_16835 [Acidimicrobiales bacterium]